MKIETCVGTFDINLADVGILLRIALKAKLEGDFTLGEEMSRREINIDSMVGAALLLGDPRAEKLMEEILTEYDSEFRKMGLFEEKGASGTLGS